MLEFRSRFKLEKVNNSFHDKTDIYSFPFYYKLTDTVTNCYTCFAVTLRDKVMKLVEKVYRTGVYKPYEANSPMYVKLLALFPNDKYVKQVKTVLKAKYPPLKFLKGYPYNNRISSRTSIIALNLALQETRGTLNLNKSIFKQDNEKALRDIILEIDNSIFEGSFYA